MDSRLKILGLTAGTMAIALSAVENYRRLPKIEQQQTNINNEGIDDLILKIGSDKLVVLTDKDGKLFTTPVKTADGIEYFLGPDETRWVFDGKKYIPTHKPE